MARIVREDVYAARRNEILNAAQRYIYTVGYEQMTIQHILDELHISKGAFYHYFDSKGALLEALVDRTLTEVEALLNPIAQDPGLTALEKLQRYFGTAIRWKTAQKAYMLALLRVWYSDDNAIVRQKIYASTTRRVTPLLSEIIGQGVREGVFSTPYPDQAGEMMVHLMQGVGDAFAGILLADPPAADSGPIEESVAAFSDALERVLGAPAGSLPLMDSESIKEWVAPTV